MIRMKGNLYQALSTWGVGIPTDSAYIVTRVQQNVKGRNSYKGRRSFAGLLQEVIADPPGTKGLRSRYPTRKFVPEFLSSGNLGAFPQVPGYPGTKEGTRVPCQKPLGYPVYREPDLPVPGYRVPRYLGTLMNPR